eukprot:g947.t1
MMISLVSDDEEDDLHLGGGGGGSSTEVGNNLGEGVMNGLGAVMPDGVVELDDKEPFNLDALGTFGAPKKKMKEVVSRKRKLNDGDVVDVEDMLDSDDDFDDINSDSDGDEFDFSNAGSALKMSTSLSKGRQPEKKRSRVEKTNNNSSTNLKPKKNKARQYHQETYKKGEAWKKQIKLHSEIDLPAVVAKLEYAFGLEEKLKDYQKVGVNFMWDRIAAGSEGAGVILADFMGLGKTIQVITLICSFFLSWKRTKNTVNDDNDDDSNTDDYTTEEDDAFHSGSDFDPNDPYAEEQRKWRRENLDFSTSSRRKRKKKKSSSKSNVNSISFEKQPIRVLVLAPAIVVANWLEEFKKWLGKTSRAFYQINPQMLNSKIAKTYRERLAIASRWERDGGVLVMGYEMFRMFVCPSSRTKGLTESMKTQFLRIFCDPGPDLIVLDEGHRIRKAKSVLTNALKMVRTKRRIVMTGYPIQNKLKEYWCMVDFARPGYLKEYEVFKRRFEIPISNGMCKDSTKKDLRRARRRAFVLNLELRGLVLRRGPEVLYKMLPNKTEWVICTRMSQLQGKLYRAFLKSRQELGEMNENGVLKNRDILQAYHISLMIVNHPDILYNATLRQDTKKNNKNRNRRIAIENIMKAKPKATVSASSDLSNDEFDAMYSKGFGDSSDDYETDDESDSGTNADGNYKIKLKLKHVKNGGNNTNGENDVQILGSHKTSETTGDSLEWASPIFVGHENNMGKASNSAKLALLMRILYHTVIIGDRISVFSQSLGTLDVIAKQIKKHNNSQLGAEAYIAHLKITGSTPLRKRFERIKRFNSPTDESNVMLISTRAGGEGVNLVGGNRIVIFDSCWNPCHDHEAMCRSHRYGQKKECFIYRLVGSGTMEKKIYELQLRKESLSKRIVDAEATERHFTAEEAAQFLSITEFRNADKLLDGEGARKDAPGNDKVMEALIKETDGAAKWMAEYYRQDSMLKMDEEGKCKGEEEEKEAIEEYRIDLGGGDVYAREDREEQEARYRQAQIQNSALAPFWGTGSRIDCPSEGCNCKMNIPSRRPFQGYQVQCPLCKTVLQPHYGNGNLDFANLLFLSRGLTNVELLKKQAAMAGARFVSVVEEASHIITTLPKISDVLEWLKIEKLPERVGLPQISVVRPSWLMTAMSTTKEADALNYGITRHHVPENEEQMREITRLQKAHQQAFLSAKKNPIDLS